MSKINHLQRSSGSLAYRSHRNQKYIWFSFNIPFHKQPNYPGCASYPVGGKELFDMTSQPITAAGVVPAPPSDNPIPPSFKFQGISGRFKLLPGESPEQFNATIGILFKTFRPSTLDTCLAAMNAAMASWLLHRADRQEAALRDHHPAFSRAADGVRHIERTRAIPRRALCRALATLGHKFEPAPAPGVVANPPDLQIQELLAQARRSKRGRPLR